MLWLRWRPVIPGVCDMAVPRWAGYAAQPCVIMIKQISNMLAQEAIQQQTAIMTNKYPTRGPILPGPGARTPPTSSPVSMQTLNPAGITLSNASVTDEEKRKKAWKYQGYKEFGRWMASDDDFFVFRRFESLNATTIAYLQYRISQLEKRLEDIHKLNEQEKDRRNSSFKWDETNQQDRIHIMNELSCLLLHYSKCQKTTLRNRTDRNRSIHRFTLQDT